VKDDLGRLSGGSAGLQWRPQGDVEPEPDEDNDIEVKIKASLPGSWVE